LIICNTDTNQKKTRPLENGGAHDAARLGVSIRISLFFFFFFLSFYFPFFVFSFFTFPTGKTTRPRRTGGGAGQNASAQDAACRVTGWASFFFLETGYCGSG
jgi:hypothetical protein